MFLNDVSNYCVSISFKVIVVFSEKTFCRTTLKNFFMKKIKITTMKRRAVNGRTV